jgi:exodeoxyribonuclease VII large subunit
LLRSLRERPALADPLRALDRHAEEIDRLRQTARAALLRGLDQRGTDIAHVQHRLTALGPAATLARGYAVVQRVTDGAGPLPVLRSVTEVAAGENLRIRVGDGALAASVLAVERAPERAERASTP